MTNGNQYGKYKNSRDVDSSFQEPALSGVSDQKYTGNMVQEFNPTSIPVPVTPLDVTFEQQKIVTPPVTPTYQPYIGVPVIKQENKIQPNITYRGMVYINGALAPSGTLVTTTTGASTRLAGVGMYTLYSVNTSNIEFMVNGFLATPQVLLSTPYEKVIDLYAVADGHAASRRQVYQKRRQGKAKRSIPKNVFGNRPRSKWFKV